MTTEVAASIVAGRRKAHGSSASIIVIRANRGVNIGWSVYPQAGGSIRKYSSSRW